MKYIFTVFAIAVAAFASLTAPIAWARAGLVSSQGMWLSKDAVFAGDTAKIYTIVNNDTYEKLSATAQFSVNGTVIGNAALGDMPKELAKQVWVEHTFQKGIAHVTVNLTNITALQADGTQAPIPPKASVTRQISADFDIDSDSDHDGVGDREDTDDDNDGVSDEDELDRGTNPLDSDTDNDGLSDKREAELGTDPKKADTDGDGLSDSDEVNRGTDPKKKDMDGDGATDMEEINRGTSPTNADTDGDGLKDGQEAQSNTNPLKADSDGDGLKDGEELKKGTNPVRKDTDGDGLSDGREAELGTNPKSSDSDDDGISDKDEAMAGTNPLKKSEEEDATNEPAPTLAAPKESGEGQVKGEKTFADDGRAQTPKWPFLVGSVFTFFFFIIFYGIYLQKRREAEE